MKKIVKQRNKSDCVIAAVAQVTGNSYAKVKRVCGSVRGGLEPHEVLWLLEKFGDWRMTTPRNNWTLREWVDKYPTGIIVIGDPFGFAHSLVAIDGVLYDPARHPINESLLVSFAFLPN